jgi:hypothetical protein
MTRFVNALFSKFPQFLRPGRHPKWRETNLAAQVPGWTRFAPARVQLQRQQAIPIASLRSLFETYINETGHAAAEFDPAHKEALFHEFIRWRSQHSEDQ